MAFTIFTYNKADVSSSDALAVLADFEKVAANDGYRLTFPLKDENGAVTGHKIVDFYCVLAMLDDDMMEKNAQLGQRVRSGPDMVAILTQY